MNLPTKLTFLRIFLIPVFVVLFFIPFPGNRFAALVVFALAAATDFLDGYLARKNNQVTTLGKFLDPIADKMLVACALIAVAADTFYPSPVAFKIAVAAFAMVILCRELLVSCFRIVAASKNVVLAADKWGKYKTVFQMIALLFLIPCGSIYDIEYAKILVAQVGYRAPFLGWTVDYVYLIGFILLAVATFLTIISGANYVVKNKGVLSDKTVGSAGGKGNNIANNKNGDSDGDKKES